jgi:3-methyl-2-oxobutanoate hydroxymethyltransferase
MTAALQKMKAEGRKIVGVVAQDPAAAQAAERAGVDLVLVGGSTDETLLEEMLAVCKAARAGVRHALLSVDLPAHEQKIEAALRARECGAEAVKLIGSADLVRSVVRAGVPVFAEFHGGKDEAHMLVVHARRLEDAGASLLDFRHSGRVAGEAVSRAVKIPVIGGPGGGPWLDGRYANLAQMALETLGDYARAVRAGKLNSWTEP